MIGTSVGSIVGNKQIQELIAVPASAMVSEAVSKMSEKGVDEMPRPRQLVRS